MGTTYKKKSKAKATKVTDVELKDLQGNARLITDLQMQIGRLEVQKTELLSGIINSEKHLKEIQVKLRDKYGDVIINIHDGSLKPREDGEVNKKD
jgi:hypothetical protein